MTDKPRLLRQGQAAEYLGVGVSTIQRMIAAGDLPTVQLTSKGWPMIDRADLDALVEQRKATVDAAPVVAPVGRPRGGCPVCRRQVPLRVDGSTFIHDSAQPRSSDPADGDDYTTCPGSHQLPAQMASL
ncbi:hypothetical protein SEA_FOSTEROUS_56 [Gordonia phage Fosterous]|uniref:Helix-turn-helix domain-containing protein n=1 Tax=Gordonia phage Fosterous TaxID=2483668 RepID=A0A3G3M8K3_9CAUD|nr:excisionase and transcriptional regulator [Gordonia phage Fosterous]AYR02776.1 hypothetical protein SEA_FOSTEROUS_56 [Gordonia phage Fosterous]